LPTNYGFKDIDTAIFHATNEHKNILVIFSGYSATAISGQEWRTLSLYPDHNKLQQKFILEIAKYNANTFKIFDASDGLPDNTVFEIADDKHNRLWFRTLNGGIGYIINDSVHAVKENSKILEHQGKGIIESFVMKDDTMMLGFQSFEECFFLKVSPPYNSENVKKINSLHVLSYGIDAMIFGNRVLFAEKQSLGNPSKKEFRFFFKIIIHDLIGKIIISDSIDMKTQGPVSKFYLRNNQLFLTSYRNIITYDLELRTILNIPQIGCLINSRCPDKKISDYKYPICSRNILSHRQAPDQNALPYSLCFLLFHYNTHE